VSVYAATYSDVALAVRVGSIHSVSLTRHAIAPALDQLQQGVEQYLTLGVVPVGVPSLHARVVSVSLVSSPADAVLSACPGSPALVSRTTHQPVKFRSLPPNPVKVDLQIVAGRWVVSLFEVDRRRTCSG